MADIKVVLADENATNLEKLKGAFSDAGLDVAACAGGFDALDELSNQGADIVIASTSLPDLNGYQLSSLVKSNDRTMRLPVVLIKGEPAEQDDFWRVAALPDELLESAALEDLVLFSEKIREIAKKAKADGWKASMVKNLLIPSRTFTSGNVVNSYAGLLDDLLIERLVTRLTRNMSGLVEPRKDLWMLTSH